MANLKISQLSAAAALDGNELVEVVQGGTNVQTTAQAIADLGGGASGNDKADALVTIVSDSGAYTLQASDLALINTGTTLIIEGDSSGDLTVPDNGTVAFPIGTVLGVRYFDNVVEGGSSSVSPTSGTLEIASGMTASLEKTGTNTWILHNGTAGGGGGGGTWGSITGTLSDQTDLDTALDAKADTTAIVGVQDLYIPASAMWPKTTSGCSVLSKSELATSLLNIQTLDFDQTTQEFAQFTMVAPRKWNNGTITAVFYWTASSGSGDVQWGLSGGAYSNDDALTVALGTAQTADDTLIATNDLHISPETSAITLAGTPADADFLGFQISRNVASDTLSGDAKLLGVSLRFTTDAAKDA